MARIKYYYDTETCKFEKATVTWQSALKTTFSYLVISGVVSVLVLTALFYMFDNPKEKRLKTKITRLVTKIEDYNQKISMIEGQVGELHERDNEVYRTILSADRISETEWQAGMGGGGKYNRIEEESVRETEQNIDRLIQKLKMQKASYAELVEKINENEDLLKHRPSIRPVQGMIVSGFGYRIHPILKFRKMHTGIDFRAPIGTPIYATGDGVVKTAGVKHNGYGKHIDLDHGYGYVTKYAHMSKLLVGQGQKVKRGDVIGYSGNTGLSKGPHLHYEILYKGKKIDPIDYFYSDLTPEQFVKLKTQASQENESMD